MYTKGLLLIVFAFFICFSAFAQDKIIKKNGEVIEAKVSVINQENIVFKRFDNLNGPEYSIPKADVARIKYANGTEDIFEEDNDKIGVKRNDIAKANGMHNEGGLNRNIISVAPIALTENGVGFGASIEHILDSKGVVNFYMPIFATFNRNDNGYTNTVTTYPMLYLMPGIKVYTNLSSHKMVKFSIGPSLVLAAGSGNLTNDNFTTTGMQTSETVGRFLLGAIGNVGINIFPTQHLYMGVEYGLGFCYLNDYGSTNEGFSSITQFSLKIGYRFR